MAILDLAAGRERSPKTEIVTKALAGPRFEPSTRQTGKVGRDFRPPAFPSLGDHSETP
jgi:hypothetical protein